MTVYEDGCGDERRKLFPFILTSFSDCMGVREVKPIFQDSVESIGQRDFMVLPTSGKFFTTCKDQFYNYLT